MTLGSRSTKRRSSARDTAERRPTQAIPEPEGERPAAGSLDRLIFLSDGVFAIAMTLLVVELTVPEIASGAPIDVGPRLWALGPRYFSYAVSFLVIASYWRAHQRIFSYVVRSDERLVWINVLLLLCIAFQPFPTSVLGRYGDQPAAVTLYAGTLATTGLIVLVLWIYATSGRRLVRPDIDRRVVTHHMWRIASVPIVFLVSIAVAQVNPSAAEYSWLGIAVVLLILRWVFRGVR